MKSIKISEYCKLMRQQESTGCCEMKDILLGKLDDLWYSMSEEERKYIEDARKKGS